MERKENEVACEDWAHDQAFMKNDDEERESIRRTVRAFASGPTKERSVP